MKKTIFLLAGIFLIASLGAQDWKTNIYSASDRSKMKTLRIKPEMSITIRSLLLDSDTLKHSTQYNGSFIGVSGDSMKIKLTNFIEFKNYTNGIRQQTTIPEKEFLMPLSSDPGFASIPLSDIDFLSYKNNTFSKMSGFSEGVVFTSIFVMILSPLICIDYSDGSFNAERYKYWGLGSSIGLVTSLTLEGLLGHRRSLQFKTNWPDKKKPVWSFSQK